MGLPKEIIATASQIKKYSEKQENIHLIASQFMKLEKILETGFLELKAEIKIKK